MSDRSGSCASACGAAIAACCQMGSGEGPSSVGPHSISSHNIRANIESPVALRRDRPHEQEAGDRMNKRLERDEAKRNKLERGKIA
eukprot:5633281-Pleurochrysis_carterae.AAC.2